MTDPFPLFHWSPTTNRQRIQHDGFKPSSWSIDREWRPPYICFADDPWMAWRLSGDVHPEIASWDLWQTWSNVPSGMEAIYDTRRDNGEPYVKEWRVYERIYKRSVWYVASRGT